MWDIPIAMLAEMYAEDRASARPGGIIRVTDPTGIQVMPMGRPVAQGKCPCCGSRQFKYHNERRVCTYCRSEQ